MANTIVGLFDSFPAAQSAVQDLISAGISRNHISLTSSNATGEHRLEGEAGAEHGSHAGTGAATGAGIGAVVGGVGGVLASLGMLVIPGIGPILAAGPIAAALAGAGIGAVAGGLLGALVGLGIPEEHAHAYAEGVRRGGTLVTVAADDAQAEPVADILNRHGAVDIDTRAAEWRSRGWAGFRHDAQPLSGDEVAREREYATAGAGSRAPGREGETGAREELAAGTRPVQRGGVRIYRRPVDRPLTDQDREAFQERSYEVRERAEEPMITKQTRVVEEVVVQGDAPTRTDMDVQPTERRDRAA
jgi:hypothetical protein